MIKTSDAAISLILALLIAVFLLIILRIIGGELGLVWQREWNWILLTGLPTLALLGIVTASYIGKKFLTVYQLAKFYLVGASSAAIDLGILNLLMWFSGIATGILFILFKILSASTSIMHGYLWNKRWTFKKNDCFFSVKEFSKFVLIISVGFLIDVSGASFLVIIIGPQFGMSGILWANFAAFIAILVASFWNFTGNKLFVFKK